MRLQLLTWQEAEERLARSPGIILPIGSTEQHGPNGLLGTDAICAEAIAWKLGEAVDALVAPTIGVGIAQHHMAFAGTMTLRPSTLIAVVRDSVFALAEHGFRRFFFVNGHGGNIATLRAAFSEVYGENLTQSGGAAPDLVCAVHSWWEGGRVGALSRTLFPGCEGSHATPSEVSVTQFLHPEAIKQAAMDPPVAPSGGFHDARDFRRRYPDGRIGSDPSRATPEAGAKLVEAAVADLADRWRTFLSET
jgi:creatinine amidohydrolase